MSDDGLSPAMRAFKQKCIDNGMILSDEQKECVDLMLRNFVVQNNLRWHQMGAYIFSWVTQSAYYDGVRKLEFRALLDSMIEMMDDLISYGDKTHLDRKFKIHRPEE